MGSKINTGEVLGGVDIVQVIGAYVPLFKSGAEYEACCPFHNEETPSFKVSPAKQIYHCFGCGANGDAIKFLQEHQGLTFQEACRSLGAGSGAPAEARRQKPPRPAVEKTTWKPVLPVPPNALAPPRAHPKRGEPETVWAYRDAAGAMLGYVCRFRTSDGGKEILPLVWAQDSETGQSMWRWMAFPAPRPLYGLDRLAEKPDAPVLMVEGEKCADAAAAELPDLVSMSWPGGGKAVDKTDFVPVAGRKVLLWADCDAKRVPLTPAERKAGVDPESKPLLPEERQPGVMAMHRVAEKLHALGCKVWMLKIPAPGEKPDGWDVADAISEGLKGAALADFIRANVALFAPAGQGGKGVSPAGPAGAGSGESGDDSWRALLIRKDEKLVDCRENVYLILKHHPDWKEVIWANVFARKIVRRNPAPWESAKSFTQPIEWDDNDDFRLGLWLAQNERMIVRSSETLSSAVGWVASETRWHPVRDYLESLQWDGVPRLEDWLTDFLGVRKTEYSALAGRMFLIGMVARIFRPGCLMRSMPILEGPQLRGKSSALRVLGGEFFSDAPLDLNNKDVYQLIQGCWLFEVGELDAFNRSEITRIKSFISSQVDRFRAPYDRAPRDNQRETCFAGTTNQSEYFKDSTGNTRYWPLLVEEVDRINLDGLAAARDQLFAEAVVMFRRGERWHPSRDEQERLFRPEQETREIIDPWMTMITTWLLKRPSSSDRVTTEEILGDLLKVEPSKIDASRSMATRVGNVMRAIGWKRKRETSGARGYFYLRPENWLSEMKKERGNDPF
ncbi:MAG: CHC2 zinc finger domain-containing protein [Betaproteobacteria bacterium]|nr:CHC2 zinc finger domain-containing protein [Betaproteobacteria bacterium]